MSPRPSVRDERRRQILQAALKVFARLGLDQARMDDIVTEAGLSKGALYWYFKSKDEIIIAILDSLFGREVAELEALLAAEGSARQRLLAFVDHALADLKATTRLAPVLYEFYALAFRNKTVRKALQADWRRYRAIAAPLIQQGIDRGEFRPIDAGQAANTLAALLEGTLWLWVIDPASVDLTQQMQASFRLFLDGLQSPSEAGALSSRSRGRPAPPSTVPR
jgi:AcrR family transcriptional regulator